MIRVLTRRAVGLSRIAAGLPWQACRELWAAGGNCWLWAVLEWDASRRRGRGRGGW